MRKAKQILSAVFVFFFVCCLFSKPASAASPATNRKGAKLYYGGFSSYIDCFDTKTGKLSSIKSSYLHFDPSNLKYHKGCFYGFNSSGHTIKLSKKGTKKKTYRFAFGCIYKKNVFYNKGSYIHRCNLKGAKDKKIVKCKGIWCITVLKNKLYYVKSTSSGIGYLYSASLSGKHPKKICKLPGDVMNWGGNDFFASYGNSLYVCGPDGIYKYYPGWDSFRNFIPLENDEFCSRFAGIHNNQLWFGLTDDEGTYLCNSDKNGGVYMKVKAIDEGSFVGVGSGNYCFYKKNGKYYSMTLSGTDIKRIRPKSLY